MSSEQKTTSENTHDTRYLSFLLGTEEYAVPLLAVKEVIAVPEITSVPATPPHFLGIMNLRGQVISLIDLRQKLGIKPQAGSETAVIICDLGHMSIGVVVDAINMVLAPASADISLKPEISSNRNTDYITHVYKKDKSMVLFLDIKKALNMEDHAALANAQKTAIKAA